MGVNDKESKVVKLIPVGENYVEPVVKETVETIDHFDVKGELFLDEKFAKRKAKRDKIDMVTKNGFITVYEVNGEKFADFTRAEKLRKSLVKKYRDELILY